MDCGLKTDDDHLEPNPIKMINPEITFLSKNFNEREEGCLSIPGHHAIVKRPDKVIVNYRDENFKQKELFCLSRIVYNMPRTLSGLLSGEFDTLDVLHTIRINDSPGQASQVLTSDGTKTLWDDPSVPDDSIT